MGILDKIKAGKIAAQQATATPAPAPVAPAPTVKQEIAKLEAEEQRAVAAFAPLSIGACPKCGDEVTKENGSRTPSGRVVHTLGCPAENIVVPNDAPASEPPLSAQALPPDANVAPAIKEIASPWQTEKPVEVVDNRATLPKEESTRKPYHLPNGEPIALPEKKTRARIVNKPENKTREEKLNDCAEPLRRALFINTYGLPDALATRANKIVDDIAEQLCAKHGVRDLRFVPKDSPLAFGGWRGALAIAVSESDEFEFDGFYTLYTDNNEIMQVASDALVKRFAVVIVGGVR